MKPKMALGDFLVAYLQRAGVSHIFGLPGDLALGLYHRFGAARGIEIVSFSHEPAVGFAAGVERLIIAIDKHENSVTPPDIYMIPLGEDAAVTASKLANDLRNSCGKIVLLETLRRSLKAQMREAGRCGAMETIIIGENELAQNKVIVKNMTSGSQQEISISDITQFFNKIS